MQIFRIIREMLKKSPTEMADLLEIERTQYHRIEKTAKFCGHEKLQKLKKLSGLGAQFWEIYEKEGGK